MQKIISMHGILLNISKRNLYNILCFLINFFLLFFNAFLRDFFRNFKPNNSIYIYNVLHILCTLACIWILYPEYTYSYS